jgi:hypothetical protein
MNELALTGPQVFALIGLVHFVCALVMGEMFERAIQNDFESHNAFDPARSPEVGDGK